MGLFRRKLRYPDDWALATVAAQFVECFHGHPDRRDLRAAAVFHLDPALAPISEMQEQSDREAAERGDVPTPITEWHAIKLEFVDDDEGSDRVSLFMHGNATAVIRERDSFDTRDEATGDAVRWVGEDAERGPFRALPGFFQTALVTAIVGRSLDHHPSDFMWVPDYAGAGTTVPVRKYPPDVDKRNDPEWSVLPRAAVVALFDRRGW